MTTHRLAPSLVCCLLAGSTCLPAADQIIGGAEEEGKLRITVADAGWIQVERFTDGQWANQIFDDEYDPSDTSVWSPSMGTLWYIDGNTYYAGWWGDGDQLSWSSNETSGDTITSSIVFNADLTFTQVVTYDGNAQIHYTWTIRNTGGAALNNLRLLHAMDTYMAGSDEAGGYYDSGDQIIEARRTNGLIMPTMTLGGDTAPYAYASAEYDVVNDAYDAFSLGNVIDAAETTDNGIGLEWRVDSLASGGEWSVGAYETFSVVYTPTRPDDSDPADNSVAENVGGGGTVGITLSSTDLDSSIEYRLSDNAEGRFFVGAAGQVFIVAGTTFDTRQDTSYRITGYATDGEHVGESASFIIHIRHVNLAPSFSIGSDITVVEDAGQRTYANWASAITPGRSDEGGQTIAFVVDDNTNPALFSQQPAVSPDGTLVFTPAADASGSATITLRLHDDGGTADDGVDTSDAQVFTINVTPVNDAPDFTPGPNITVLQGSDAYSAAWASALSAGAANESAQTLSFTVSNSNSALFSVQPAIAADGTLTFTPAAGVAGSTLVNVFLADSAGARTAPFQFVITVTPVNQAPSFEAGANATVAEDAGLQSIANWATSISAGSGEAGQHVDFVIDSNTNPALFSQIPAVTPEGTLIFTPAANANGTATITLHAHDDGGTANGGADASATRAFTIAVTAVNDTPTFTPGPDLLVAEDAGAQSIPWATDISSGPTDEEAQTLAFAVTNTNSALFAAQPAMAADGTLAFTPAADASGTAIVGVRLADDGDGADTSAIAYFTITVSSENDAPGQAVPSSRTVLEDHVLTLSAENAIVLSDVDAGSSWITTTLRVDHGTLSLAQTDNLVFLVGTGTNEPLVTVQGSVSAINAALDGLHVDPGSDYYGSVTLSIATNDNGNTGNGGSQGVSGSVGITVTPVNDAPSCILGAEPTVKADGQVRSLPQWIAAVSPGPSNEASQGLVFEVSVDRPELFVVQPAIAADGTLTFTPGTTIGRAVLSVRAVDDGGTADGGIDRGAAMSSGITLVSADSGGDESAWVKGRDKVTNCGGGSALGMILASLGLMLALRQRRR